MPKALTHCLKHFLGTEPAHSQLSPSEKSAISQLARNASQILEIGIFEGSTTSMLIANAPANAHVQAIDPFLAGRIGICWGKFVADREIAHAKRSNPSVKISIHRNFSKNVIIPVEFDLIFVDGDHSLEGITQDWADWSGKVATGGSIVLHDSLVPSYNPNVANLGSSQYYASHISKDDRFQLVNQVDSMVVLQRR
jgi:hypothetical protein